MGLLKDLENRLEKLVDGIFAENFQASVEPIEIASQLKKIMLDNKKLSVKNYYVPSNYEVELSPDDHTQISALGHKLVDELRNYLVEEAMAHGVEPVTEIKIEITANEKLKNGKFAVRVIEGSHSSVPGKDALAYIEIEGQDSKIPLRKNAAKLGRSSDNDVSLPYEKISRNHAKISLEDGGYTIEDLGSTNGVFIDNKRITKSFVPYGKTILIADLPVSVRRNYA